MPHSALPSGRIWGGLVASVPQHWRAPLLRLTLAGLTILIAFFSDWAAMADQWWNSSTYNHVLLVPFIIVWLVQQRAGELAKLEPTAWWPGLVLAGGAVLLWTLGAFAGVATARQLGVVLIVAFGAVTLLGPRVGAGLLFPLGYLLFLVPFGDELVPALQMITADITIALVHLSGIPATIDGVFIDTPAGLFEVAEACSGVKFLIAMVAFGVLVANTCFKSWRRRWPFLLACVVVPIVANGIRAWGTIFAAQFVGVEIAAGFDHIVYGWIFFAIVLVLVIAGGWRFFDRAVDDPAIDAETLRSSPLLGRLARMSIGAGTALAALAAMLLASQAWVRTADALSAEIPPQIFLPAVPGWHRTDYAPTVWWEPRAEGADHRLLGSYADDRGRRVDVFVALYASQGEGREAGGFGQGALPPDGTWAWLSPGPATDDATGERLLAQGYVERLTQTSYRTGTLTTGSNVHLKLQNMADRVALRARPTMLLILSAEERQDRSAAQALHDFRKSAGPLDRWMDRVASVR